MKLAWLVTNIYTSSIEFWSIEPPDWIMYNTEEYLVKQIVYSYLKD